MSVPTSWLAACPGCGLVTAHPVAAGQAVCRECGRRFASGVIATAEATRRRRDGNEFGGGSAEADVERLGLAGGSGGTAAGGGVPRSNDAGEPSPPSIPPASIRLQDGGLSA